jgi:hypothetical protein
MKCACAACSRTCWNADHAEELADTWPCAIFLAVATWYLVTGREKVEVWLPMSVEMTNPPSA